VTKIALGIIGCGAVVQKYHLPATRKTSEIEVVYLVDHSLARAQAMAQQFDVPNCTDDYTKLFGKVEAVVVATPNDTHAPISIDCLRHGIHVLCEKPMATSTREAEMMVEASECSGAHLAIGFVRRMYPCSRVMKRLLEIGMLGELTAIDVQEGYELAWPQQTLSRFVKGRTGGGVLVDTGSHMLDLLQWWIGDIARIDKYEDDNFGGVEANVKLKLTMIHRGLQIPVTIELSFMRPLRNSIRVFGDKAWAEIEIANRIDVFIYPNPLPSEEVFECRARYPQYAQTDEVDYFAAQLSAFIQSILHSRQEYATAAEAAKTLRIIEQCYRNRYTLMHTWEAKHLTGDVAASRFQSTFSESQIR